VEQALVGVGHFLLVDERPVAVLERGVQEQTLPAGLVPDHVQVHHGLGGLASAPGGFRGKARGRAGLPAPGQDGLELRTAHRGLPPGPGLELALGVDDVGQAGLAHGDAFHQLVEGHEVHRGPQNPLLAPGPHLDRHDEVRGPAQAQEHVADVQLAAHGLAEPGGLGVVRALQPEGPGVGHLEACGVDQAHVHEGLVVPVAQALEDALERDLVAEPVLGDEVGQDPDDRELLGQEAVDVALVLHDQFPQVGVDPVLVGGVELVAGDDADQGQGSQGNEEDREDHAPGQRFVIMAVEHGLAPGRWTVPLLAQAAPGVQRPGPLPAPLPGGS